jgi:hypothetical protein
MERAPIKPPAKGPAERVGDGWGTDDGTGTDHTGGQRWTGEGHGSGYSWGGQGDGTGGNYTSGQRSSQRSSEEISSAGTGDGEGGKDDLQHLKILYGLTQNLKGFTKAFMVVF